MDFRAFVDEFELLVRSRYALIVIDTWEIDRAADAARRVASQLSMHFHDWTRSKGITRGTLRKRNHDPAAFDLRALAEAAEGFSGSEIEQSIVSALFEAFARGGRLGTELLIGELHATRPLSRTMSERLGSLRAWARERTVNADGPLAIRAVAWPSGRRGRVLV